MASIRGAPVFSNWNAQTWTPTMPTHATGDLLVAAYAPDTNAGILTAPSGWTAGAISPQFAGGNDCEIAFYWKLAASSSETSPSLQWTTGARVGEAVVVSVQSPDGTTPNDVAPVGAAGASGSSWAMPTITPPASGALLLSFAAIDAASSQTQPYFTSITAPLTIIDSQQDPSGLVNLGVAAGNTTSASQAYTGTWATTRTADTAAVVCLAVRPAVSTFTPRPNVFLVPSMAAIRAATR